MSLIYQYMIRKYDAQDFQIRIHKNIKFLILITQATTQLNVISIIK